MEVILNQDFPSLGYVGDTVRVRPGYARNYLIPRGVAIEASARNNRQLRHRLLAINAKKIKLRAEAEEFAKRLSTVMLEFNVRIGAQGKAFGAITARDIEAALQKEGVSLDRRQIKLSEPIKKAGEFSVMIKLHSEVLAPVAVRVIAEMPESSKKSDGAERKARGKKGSAEKGEEATGRKRARKADSAHDEGAAHNPGAQEISQAPNSEPSE